jgi:hypothetical protein
MTSEPQQKPKREKNLSVYVFNVGQGDNVLLRLPNGHYGIIDFYYEAGLNLHEPPALTYLKRVRERLRPEIPLPIAFIYLTHPDGDHIKGAKQLLDWISDKKNNVQFGNLWLWPGEILDDLIDRYDEFAYSTSQSNSTRRASEVKRQIRAVLNFRDSIDEDYVQYLAEIRKVTEDVGGGIKAVTVAPLGTHVKKFNKKSQRAFVKWTTSGKKGQVPPKNLLSSILMLIYQDDLRLLFGGDTLLRVWEDCHRNYYRHKHNKDHGDLKGDFVKASHHGSKHSSSLTLWPKILSPNAHVSISAGKRKNYGHPHRETIGHLSSHCNAQEAELERIVTTNSCRECIESKPWAPNYLDWVGKRPTLRRPIKDEVKDTFPDSFKFEKTGKTTPEDIIDIENSTSEQARYLAAYIYRFRRNKTIGASKGLTSTVGSDEPCAFKTDDSQRFPHCILKAKKSIQVG